MKALVLCVSLLLLPRLVLGSGKHLPEQPVLNLCDLSLPAWNEPTRDDSNTTLNAFRSGCCDKPGRGTSTPNGWVLVGGDDFETPGMPDPNKWIVADMNDGSKNFYTKRPGPEGNVRIDRCRDGDSSTGCLIITSRKEAYPDPGGAKDENGNPIIFDYTSGYLSAASLVVYGRYEIRAKISNGRGLWPAIWFNGKGYHWPPNGEIDMLESVGFQPCQGSASAHSCLHNWGNDDKGGASFNFCSSSCVKKCNDCAAKFRKTNRAHKDYTVCNSCAKCYRQYMNQFHTYTMDWLPGHLSFAIDGHTFLNVTPDPLATDIPWKQPPHEDGSCHDDNIPDTVKRWPYDGEPNSDMSSFGNPFNFVIDMAIGGDWGGGHGIDPAIFPATLEVAYVHVYRPSNPTECLAGPNR